MECICICAQKFFPFSKWIRTAKISFPITRQIMGFALTAWCTFCVRAILVVSCVLTELGDEKLKTCPLLGPDSRNFRIGSHSGHAQHDPRLPVPGIATTRVCQCPGHSALPAGAVPPWRPTRCHTVLTAPISYVNGLGLDSRPGGQLYWDFFCFPQPLQIKSGASIRRQATTVSTSKSSFTTMKRHNITDHRGQVVGTPASYSRGGGGVFPLSNFSPETGYPDWYFRGFSQSLRANVEMVLLIRPRPLPSLSFPIQYSLHILSIDAI
jgi:hypothetical protein